MMYISMPLPPTEQLLNGDSYSSQEDGSQCPHMNAWFGAKGLHITHLNVHYLYPKLDELKLLLSEQNIYIFCLCETFLQSHGGGLIVYTRLAAIWYVWRKKKVFFINFHL